MNTSKVKSLCEHILKEHSELKRFLFGFAKPPECYCQACSFARELLTEIELTEIERKNNAMYGV